MSKRFPSKLELEQEVPENVVCKVLGCNKSFKHSSALRFHMVKVHNVIKTNSDLHIAKREKMISIECQYHCPEERCKYYYHNQYSKFFASMKLLRQHYKQVHCLRKFVCAKCGSKFSRKFDLKRHQIRENVESFFQTVPSDQLNNFHTINKKNKNESSNHVNNNLQSTRLWSNELRPILPKPDIFLTPMISDVLWNLDNSVVKVSNLPSCMEFAAAETEDEKMKSSTTQTNEGLMYRTISTQTPDDSFLLIKANRISQGSQVLWSKRNQLTEHENSHTQTNILNDDTFSTYGICLPQISSNYQMINYIRMIDCQTQTLPDLCDLQPSSYLLNDNGYSCLQDECTEQHSSGNEASSSLKFISESDPLKTLSSISLQTSYNELLHDINCSAGTQTGDPICYEESSQYLSLNNIETQTADMFNLDPEEFINNLEYTDIETQTSYRWDDYLDNRGDQGRLNLLFSDTETQTHY